MNDYRPIGWKDHFFGAFFAASYVALLLYTSLDLAMTRDESFYFLAAENIARWLEVAWDDWARAIDPAVIAHHWEYNHEHPALMKTLFALSWLAHTRWDLFPTDGAAFRFPGMLTAGLLLWLVYIFGARAISRPVGAFAAAAMALMPRFFYHAHLDCFDIPIVFFLTLVTYTYWRSLDRPKWAWAVGLTYGLALATKHNAWILPGALGIHFVWIVLHQWRRRFEPGQPRGLSQVPWWLLAMVVIGIPVFVATWPWLWNDGVERWLWYASFHTNHDHIPIAYFGHTYTEPPFPIAYPWVMTAITLPATIVLLTLFGLVFRSPALLPMGRATGGPSAGRFQLSPDRRFTDVLWLGSLLAPFMVISLPTTPIFGGTKHWMPAYPFVALFAGVGFERVISEVQRGLDRTLWFSRLAPWLRSRTLKDIVCALLLLVPGVIETAHSHPFGLSHYGSLVGHVPGAADYGMNRQFWGYSHGPLGDWLRQALPSGGTVWPGDATHFSWHMSQRDGMIPENIHPTGHLADADYILIHHEDHFADVYGQIWTVLGTAAPVHVLTYDGVPIVSIYKNPQRR